MHHLIADEYEMEPLHGGFLPHRAPVTAGSSDLDDIFDVFVGRRQLSLRKEVVPSSLRCEGGD